MSAIVCLSTVFTHQHSRQAAFRQRSSLAKQSGDSKQKQNVLMCGEFIDLHIAYPNVPSARLFHYAKIEGNPH